MRKVFSTVCLLFIACLGIQAAKVDTVKVRSQKMNKDIEVVTIRPDKALKGEKCPTVFLLHGYAGHAKYWLSIRPDLPEIAERDVASSALAAAGCQIVLFTTGRGTPFGTFVPTAKISTNSTLAANKPLWIDFNAGEIVDGRPSEDVDAAFVDFVLGVASGEMTNNEKSGYSEIAIFKSGITL